MQSLSVSSDSYGSLIPQEIKLIISRELGSGDWKLGRIMQLLETRVQARERASSNGAAPQALKRSTKTAALVADSTNVKTACYFCGQPHYSSAYSVVTSVEERRRILREKDRCLRKGHIMRNCQSESKYGTCGGRSLCTKAVNNPNSHYFSRRPL